MKHYYKTYSLLLAMTLATFSGHSSALEYPVIDTTKSKITFSSKLMGSNISGRFSKFWGKVNFNPEDPEKSKANLAIEIASFTAGDDELQDEAKGKDWFNVKNFPTANFVSDSVRSVSPGKLEIHGTLTIKGKTQDLIMAASYNLLDKQMIFDTSFQLLRLNYGLGAGIWSDTLAVANEVPVKVHLVLNQK